MMHFFPWGILFNTLSLGPLQKVITKEGDKPSHIAPRTNTFVNDTKKTTKDDKHPWLDAYEK